MSNRKAKKISKKVKMAKEVRYANRVVILQRRRRLLVSTNSTENMVESREGFIPLNSATLQLIQPVNEESCQTIENLYLK